MKVKNLLKILRDMDPEANVLLDVQPNQPIEYSVTGVVQRSEFSEFDPTEAACGGNPNDVLLLAGVYLRYGSRAAWKVMPRAN